MNELSKVEKESIVSLLRLGWGIRRIARETGHRHETIRRYGRAAGLIEAKPHTGDKVPTDPQPAELSGRSACEPHRAFITAEFEKGRNATSIYQDLVDHYGFCDAYDTVKRFVRKLNAPTKKVFCRFETAPGQEAQVD